MLAISTFLTTSMLLFVLVLLHGQANTIDDQGRRLAHQQQVIDELRGLLIKLETPAPGPH